MSKLTVNTDVYSVLTEPLERLLGEINSFYTEYIPNANTKKARTKLIELKNYMNKLHTTNKDLTKANSRYQTDWVETNEKMIETKKQTELLQEQLATAEKNLNTCKQKEESTARELEKTQQTLVITKQTLENLELTYPNQLKKKLDDDDMDFQDSQSPESKLEDLINFINRIEGTSFYEVLQKYYKDRNKTIQLQDTANPTWIDLKTRVSQCEFTIQELKLKLALTRDQYNASVNSIDQLQRINDELVARQNNNKTLDLDNTLKYYKNHYTTLQAKYNKLAAEMTGVSSAYDVRIAKYQLEFEDYKTKLQTSGAAYTRLRDGVVTLSDGVLGILNNDLYNNTPPGDIVFELGKITLIPELTWFTYILTFIKNILHQQKPNPPTPNPKPPESDESKLIFEELGKILKLVTKGLRPSALDQSVLINIAQKYKHIDTVQAIFFGFLFLSELNIYASEIFHMRDEAATMYWPQIFKIDWVKTNFATFLKILARRYNELVPKP